MWCNIYVPPKNNINFKLNTQSRQQLIDLCIEEVFLDTKVYSVNALIEKANKNIFLTKKLTQSEKYFIELSLALLIEKELDITEENIEQYVMDWSQNNPMRVFLMANHYQYITVKSACLFIASVNPEIKKDQWKEYLTDFQQVFSTNYFSSDEFKKIVEFHSITFKNFFIDLMRAKNILLEGKIDTFNLNIASLLNTDFVNKRTFDKNNLLADLMDQTIIVPHMLDSYGTKTLFESIMLNPDEKKVWWLKKSLIDFEEEFDFEKMEDFFQEFILSKFNFKNFQKERKAYDDVLELIKNFKLKRSMENYLSIKIIEKKLESKI